MGEIKESAMKTLSVSLNTVLIIVLIIVVLAFGLPGGRAQAEAPADLPGSRRMDTQSGMGLAQTDCGTGRSVQVSGSAVVNVAPDRALVQLGVQSNGISPSAVQEANSLAIQHVIRTIQAFGISSKDIATDLYIIEPIYEDYDSLYIKGYRINNIVAVTLRDVSKTSAVIAAALEAGANQVVNVELYTSELRKYRDQARDLAMKAALEKAQALAKAAGVETNCVLSINENTWSYYNGWWYGRDRNLWTQNTVQNAAPGGGAGSGSNEGPVSLGQISVRAEVGATFSLK
jgi:uncharacterized protein YggE